MAILNRDDKERIVLAPFNTEFPSKKKEETCTANSCPWSVISAGGNDGVQL